MARNFFILLFCGLTSVVQGQDTISLPFIEDFSSYTGRPDTNKFADEGGVFINNHFAKNTLSRNTATFDGLDTIGIPYDQIPAGGNPNFPRNGDADYLMSLPIDLDGLDTQDSTIFSFWWQKGGISNLLQPELNEGDSLQLFFLDRDSVWQYVWPLGDEKDKVINTTEGSDFQVASIELDTAYLHGGFRFRFESYGSLTSNYDMWNINHIVLDTSRADGFLQDVAFGTRPGSMLKNYAAMPYKQFQADISSELADEVTTTVHSVFGVDVIVRDSSIILTDDVSGTRLDSTVTDVDPGITGAYILSSGDKRDVSYTPDNPSITTLLMNLNADEEYIVLTNTFSANFDDDIDTNNTNSHTTYIDNYYAYDDGTAELGFGIRETGSIAVGFDLAVADELESIDLSFVRNGVDMEFSTITLRVWKSLAGIDGAEETETLIQTQVSLIFDDYDQDQFYNFQLSTSVELEPGRFYIGWDQINLADRLLIGEDISFNSFQNVYQNIGGTWNQDWRNGTVEGSLMVRPYFGPKRALGIGDYTTTANVSEVIAYPNPCSSQLTIENNRDWTNYQILTMNGDEVLSGEMDFNLQVLNLDLTEGIYLLKLLNDEHSATEKITVINR